GGVFPVALVAHAALSLLAGEVLGADRPRPRLREPIEVAQVPRHAVEGPLLGRPHPRHSPYEQREPRRAMFHGCLLIKLGGASGAPPKPPARFAGINPAPLAVLRG